MGIRVAEGLKWFWGMGCGGSGIDGDMGGRPSRWSAKRYGGRPYDGRVLGRKKKKVRGAYGVPAGQPMSATLMGKTLAQRVGSGV